jgi:hypothetical protein
MALTGSLGERSLEDGGLKGRRFPLTLTRNGEISDFGGSDTLKVSLNLNGPGRYTVKEFFENYTGSFFPVLPTGPRKIGETWEGGREFNQNIGGFDILFQIESVTTLEGFESVGTIRCLKLQSEGQFVAEGSASEGRRRLDGEGEIQTITLFDYQTGRLIRHDLDFFGEFTMAQAQAGTIPATLESKIHVQQRF